MKQKVSKLAFGVGFSGLPGLYASFCALPVYVAGQRRSSPGLMLGFLCCRVMMEHAVDVDRYCSEVIYLLLLM